MARNRCKLEQIVSLLREAEVRLGKDKRIIGIAERSGIPEQSYYPWRRAYGDGLKLEQAKRFKVS